MRRPFKENKKQKSNNLQASSGPDIYILLAGSSPLAGLVSMSETRLPPRLPPRLPRPGPAA